MAKVSSQDHGTGTIMSDIQDVYISSVTGSHLDRLSENTKPENIGIDFNGFMTRNSVEIPILEQPVDL